MIGLFSVKIEFEEVMDRKMIRVVGGKRSSGERQLAFFFLPLFASKIPFQEELLDLGFPPALHNYMAIEPVYCHIR